VSKAKRVARISAEKLCAYTGLTDRQHRNIAKNGFFPPPYKGQYQEEETITGLFKYLREQTKRAGEKARQTKQRLEDAKADMAEEELAEFREQYVLKKLIGPALRNISLHQRAVLQRMLEGELGPKLAGLKTPEILARMRDAVDEICKVFQEGTRGWLEKSYPDGAK
jgi:hypothetical protein